MARKIDLERANIEVTDIVFYEGSMLIYWAGDIGWGQYWIGMSEDGEWEADSECMDKGSDKKFLELLLKKASEYIAKRVLIVG